MDRSLTWILSDLHLRHGFANDAATHRVRQLAEDPSTRAIVLAGDTWDFSWWPAADIPPRPELFVGCQIRFLDALREAAKRCPVHIVVGNHDAGLDQAMLDRALFPRGLPPGASARPVVGPAFAEGAVLAYHGHEDSLFCAPDFEADPKNGRPMGWYIARAAVTSGLGEHTNGAFIRSVAFELVQLMFGNEKVGGAVLDAVRNAAHAGPGDLVRDPDGAGLAWRRIHELYADLMERWTRRKGARSARQALLADCSLEHGLMPSMRRRAVGGVRTVVTGHTHAPALLEVGGRVLVNAGAYGPARQRDEVRIEHKDDGRLGVDLLRDGRAVASAVV